MSAKTDIKRCIEDYGWLETQRALKEIKDEADIFTPPEDKIKERVAIYALDSIMEGILNGEKKFKIGKEIMEYILMNKRSNLMLVEGYEVEAVEDYKLFVK
jgi:hypothetical protein